MGSDNQELQVVHLTLNQSFWHFKCADFLHLSQHLSQQCGLQDFYNYTKLAMLQKFSILAYD